jgi:hypothetical protein
MQLLIVVDSMANKEVSCVSSKLRRGSVRELSYLGGNRLIIIVTEDRVDRSMFRCYELNKLEFAFAI